MQKTKKKKEVDMDIYRLDEKIAGLVKKSKQTGIPYGILKKSYDRGMAGKVDIAEHYSTTMGICKSELNGNWRKGRPRLTETGKGSAKKAKKEASSPAQQAAIAIDMKKRGIKPKNVQEWFESNRTRASYQLRHGDDWWWKLNEVHDAMLEKIGADCCDDCGEELNENQMKIRLTFNSPADVKKAKKWMDNNLPSANQGFTGVDYSNKDEFEDVDDAMV